MPETQGFSYCIIEDMHLKGMCISLKGRLYQKQPLKISFAIYDSSESIQVEADVPWAKEERGQYMYGLSFIKINDEDKDKIYQYITANCYDQFKDKWWA